MIRALAAERRAGTAVPILAAKFMNTLIEMAAEQAAEAAEMPVAEFQKAVGVNA